MITVNKVMMAFLFTYAGINFSGLFAAAKVAIPLHFLREILQIKNHSGTGMVLKYLYCYPARAGCFISFLRAVQQVMHVL